MQKQYYCFMRLCVQKEYTPILLNAINVTITLILLQYLLCSIAIFYHNKQERYTSLTRRSIVGIKLGFSIMFIASIFYATEYISERKYPGSLLIQIFDFGGIAVGGIGCSVLANEWPHIYEHIFEELRNYIKTATTYGLILIITSAPFYCFANYYLQESSKSSLDFYILKAILVAISAFTIGIGCSLIANALYKMLDARLTNRQGQ